MSERVGAESGRLGDEAGFLAAQVQRVARFLQCHHADAAHRQLGHGRQGGLGTVCPRLDPARNQLAVLVGFSRGHLDHRVNPACALGMPLGHEGSQHRDRGAALQGNVIIDEVAVNLYKETLCAACGADHCQIVGRPIEEWPDGEAHRVYFTDDSLMDKMEALQSQVEALKSTLEPVSLGGQLIGDSLGFRKAYTLMQKVAPTQATVLLTGETGVGKERFARALHELSNRADKPFVAVNCAALPAELIEAELFGVEKGAYTGAHAARAGRFERADGGTLLLDEVGEMPMAAQTKLLRVLQEGEIERVGGETTRKVNVRLVAATNVDLAQAVQAGRFRADLMYRLNVYPICIPPLRERKADIEPLAQAMLARFCALHGKRVMGIEERALQALRQHDWPGNVRELENLIERGVILATQAGMVEVEHLFPNQPDTAQTGLNANGQLVRLPSAQDDDLSTRILNSGSSLDEIEARVLDHAVARASGNLSEAARLLGLTRPQLAYRLKRQHASEADAPASKPAQE